jgi:hypothetical protein
MEESKKYFNFIFDDFVNYDEQTTIANSQNLYERNMGECTMLIKHFIDESHNQNKFDYRKRKIDEVYQNNNEKFYYFIGHASYTLVELFNINDPLNENVKKCLKGCNNFNVVFVTEHEPDSEEGFIVLMNYIKKNEFNSNQFYFINNNAKNDTYPKKFNFDINVHDVEFLPSSSTIVLRNMGESTYIPVKDGKFFMCFNKSPKPHRLSLLVLMMNNFLLDDTNWSYIPSSFTYPKGDYYNGFFDVNDLKIFNEEIEYIYSLKIKKSDYENQDERFKEFSEVDLQGLPFWMRTVPIYPYNYENSYINIVTESMFLDNQNVIHITEKSFKPFYFYQFPMILATQGHIKKMKERYDFDFFEDVIDHSYDDESNQKVRLFKFVNELKKLNQKKEELKEFYKYNHDRFENNKQKVLNILKSEKDYEYFLSLI